MSLATLRLLDRLAPALIIVLGVLPVGAFVGA